MPRLILFALLLVAALPLHAQQEQPVTVPAVPPASNASAPSKPLAPTGRITGTVMCADTHRPARGAMMIVAPVPSADATDTNKAGGGPNLSRVALDGSYSLEHLAPGEYSVMAVLPGYLSHMDEIISNDTSPAVVRKELLSIGTVTIAGSETQRFDILLQRGAAISGRVLFADGAPATQVTIDIENVNANKLTGEKAMQAKMGAAMSRTMFTHQSQNTDDQGHFRISGLKPGTYRVAAVSSLSNTDDSADGLSGMLSLLGGSFDPSALRVYSGDTLHSKAAKTYELRPGDEADGIDITIPLNAYHVVKGTLTAVDGRSVNKGTVTLTDTTDDSVTLQTEVSDQGTFAFATVAAGTYTLAAKEAKIVARQDGVNPDLPLRFSPNKITAAFADGTSSVIVKDTDVPDVSLTLTEVPLPPDANKPLTPDPDD